jgi:hypothetical protein
MSIEDNACVKNKSTAAVLQQCRAYSLYGIGEKFFAQTRSRIYN